MLQILYPYRLMCEPRIDSILHLFQIWSSSLYTFQVLIVRASDGVVHPALTSRILHICGQKCKTTLSRSGYCKTPTPAALQAVPANKKPTIKGNDRSGSNRAGEEERVEAARSSQPQLRARTSCVAHRSI
jgi:hypothetical protein